MSWQRPIVAVLAAVLCASVVSACGGGGDSGDSKSEVVTKANEICSQAGDQARQYAEARDVPSDPDEVTSALAKDAQLAQQVSTKLSQLNPPEDGRASFDTFVATQQKSAAFYKTQIAATKSGDSKQFLNTTDDLLDKTDDAKTSAKAYGLTDCPYEGVAVLFGRLVQQKGGGANSGGTSGSGGDIVGDWTGKVTQYGPGNKTYRYAVDMNVKQLSVGAVSGTIRYPSFPCSGQLQLSRRSGDRYVFKERITSGTSRCTTGGTIVTTVGGDRLSWRWVGKVGRTPIQVLGSLGRHS